MARFSLLILGVSALASFVSGAPIPVINDLARRQNTSFKLLEYSQFQISDGVAGKAKEEAEAVFVEPFKGVDLASLDKSVVADIETMRKAAENAETELFNPAIKEADGAEVVAEALQNGKIKNKVLKLTGFTQKLKIQIAQAQAAGKDIADLEDKLEEEQTKLDKNIATDRKNAGAASLSA